jgi:hypothetical protein
MVLELGIKKLYLNYTGNISWFGGPHSINHLPPFFWAGVVDRSCSSNTDAQQSGQSRALPGLLQHLLCNKLCCD